MVSASGIATSSHFLWSHFCMDWVSKKITTLWCSRKSFTHWSRGKMPCNFQTTFSNGFFSNQFICLSIKLHISLFLVVQLTIFYHWFRLWLVAWSTLNHFLNRWSLVYWSIYASLSLSKLNLILSDANKYNWFELSLSAYGFCIMVRHVRTLHTNLKVVIWWNTVQAILM